VRTPDFSDALRAIEARTDLRLRLAVVLGSGLGDFAGELTDRVEIPYAEIPGWPPSTAIGHAGKLVIGRIGGVEIAVMAGRAHLYEGYSPEQVVHGVRVLGKLGASGFVFTNAAGGINPLVGPNDESLGPRFPDMSEAYSKHWRGTAKQVAAELGIDVAEGVYAALLGPSYETPAEIRWLRSIGADLVGMSTVPEVIAANHMGLNVLAISCVSNMAAGILPRKITHEEVLETGRMVREKLVRYLKALLPRLEV